ncbi:MAG: hypothetical protein E7238_06235 [Sarcina sp.]|nr:hypothetical protein [Sarcina sp.]
MKGWNRKYRLFSMIIAAVCLAFVIQGCGAKKEEAGNTKEEVSEENAAVSPENKAGETEGADASASGQSVFDFMGDSGFTRLRADMEAGELPVECKVRYETQTAQPDVRTKDPDTIRKLYDYLTQVRVLDRAPEGSSGTVHTITFRLRNDTYVACRFDGGRYFCKGTERYETSGAGLLLSCIEQMETTALARAEAQKDAAASEETAASGTTAGTGSTASGRSDDGATIVWELPEEEEEEKDSENKASDSATGEVPAGGLETADQLLRNDPAPAGQSGNKEDAQGQSALNKPAAGQAETANKQTKQKEDSAQKKTETAQKKTETAKADSAQKKESAAAQDQAAQKKKKDKATAADPEDRNEIAFGSSEDELRETTGLAVGQAGEETGMEDGLEDGEGGENVTASMVGPAGEDDASELTDKKAQTGTASIVGPAGEGDSLRTADSTLKEEADGAAEPAEAEGMPETADKRQDGPEESVDVQTKAADPAAQPDMETGEKEKTEETEGAGTDLAGLAAVPAKADPAEKAAAAEKADTAEKAAAAKTAAAAEKAAEEKIPATGDKDPGETADQTARAMQEAYTAILRAYAAGRKLDRDRFFEDYNNEVYVNLKKTGKKDGKAVGEAERLVNYDLLWESFLFENEEASLLYGLHDYNGDGIMELAAAIGTEDYAVVWAVYTFDGKKAVELFTEPWNLGERSSLYCLPDKTFLLHQSGGAATGCDTICRIAKGGKGLEIIGAYEYDELTNGNMDYVSDKERIPFEQFQEKYWKEAVEAGEGIEFSVIDDGSTVKIPD